MCLISCRNTGLSGGALCHDVHHESWTMLWDDRIIAVIPLCVQNSLDFGVPYNQSRLGKMMHRWKRTDNEAGALNFTYWILYMLNFICMYRQSDIRMYSYHCPDSRGFGDWSQTTDDTRLGTGRRPPALRHWPNTCSQFRPRRSANRPPPQPKSTKKLMDFNGFWWFMDCNIFQLILMDSNGWVLKPWGSKIMGFSWGFLNKKWVVDLCELQ